MHFLVLPFRTGLAGAGALLLALVLTGCGNGGNGDRDEAPRDPPAQTTDLVWDEGNWDELNWQ